MIYINTFSGIPIYIATREYQKRKHHKKRINKKWRKRYGCYEVNYMQDEKVVFVDGALWMTKATYEKFVCLRDKR